jgi:hypothetical protein
VYASGDAIAFGGEIPWAIVWLNHCCFHVGLSPSFVEFLESFLHIFFAVRLTGEFTLLEEPTDDPDIVIPSALLADRPDFAGSERRVEPKGPT